MLIGSRSARSPGAVRWSDRSLRGGDLEVQVARIASAFGPEVAHRGDQGAVLELTRREVDRDAQRRAGARDLASRGAGKTAPSRPGHDELALLRGSG
jgi:hypothetical protein